MTRSSTANTASVFERLGLRQTGFWRSVAVPEEHDAHRPAGWKLRAALQELGGIYGVFAQFLQWRADLLNAEYIAGLREVHVGMAPIPVSHLVVTLRRELGGAADELLQNLNPEPIWSTLCRTAWRSSYLGAPVIVQIARPRRSDAEFDAFDAGISQLRHPDVATLISPAILAEFREWARQCESLTQERSYLKVLAANKDQILVDYPVLIPELSTDAVLVWPWIEGEPISVRIASGSMRAVTLIATAVLEQFCSLGIVDAELDLDSMIIADSGRLCFRRLSRSFSVPPSLVNLGMKYIAAVLAGESSQVVQNLLPLTAGRSTLRLEKQLMNALSSVEPELKVHLWYPNQAAAFESNWKALTRLRTERPLFLNVLHRNLIAIGYWNADAVKGGAPREDAIEKAHWPVVAAILSSEASRFKDEKVLKEWGVGAALLMFGSLRTANRLAEEIRDNSFTMGLDSPGTTAGPRISNRFVRQGAAMGFLLILLLVALRYGAHAHGGPAIMLGAVALLAAAGLFWVVSRIV